MNGLARLAARASFGLALVSIVLFHGYNAYVFFSGRGRGFTRPSP
ncbi:MAG TPA: hypothetical protein VKG44_01385 [Candidatus Baltobacteraceae bacterium]|nr:hypothetical protein [Candidatus Baltobacteraceae bacterium]